MIALCSRYAGRREHQAPGGSSARVRTARVGRAAGPRPRGHPPPAGLVPRAGRSSPQQREVILVDLPGHGQSPALVTDGRPVQDVLREQFKAFLDDQRPRPPARRRQLPRRPGRARTPAPRATPASVTALSPAGFWRNGKEFAYTRQIFTARLRAERAARAPRADLLARTRGGRQLMYGLLCAHPARVSPDQAARRLPRLPARPARPAHPARRGRAVHRRDPAGRPGDHRLGRPRPRAAAVAGRDRHARAAAGRAHRHARRRARADDRQPGASSPRCCCAAARPPPRSPRSRHRPSRRRAGRPRLRPPERPRGCRDDS